MGYRTPKLRIEINGSEVTITGEREVMQGSLPLSILNYVEYDGLIQTTIYDPDQYARREHLNALIGKNNEEVRKQGQK